MNIVRHFGIPIHVTKTDLGYEADYTALSHFIGDPGGIAKGHTEDFALGLARVKIDNAIMAVSNKFDR